jgi:enoyl-CoA hydratase/carnithine racemase
VLATDPILYELRDGVAFITLNRPEKLNSLDREAVAALGRAWAAFAGDRSARVAILSGAGARAFSTGADLKERAASGDPYANRWGQGEAAGGLMRDLKKPVIAAIHGYCLAGGFEMALGCDIRIAAPSARLGLPQIQRGSYPGGAGLGRLARIIPLGAALEIVLTGDPVDAETALRIGLINAIVSEEELLTAAEALARRIARNAPLAVEAAREAVVRSLDMPLDHWTRYNQLYRTLIGQTEDAKEGPRAFTEKRAPVWKGR